MCFAVAVCCVVTTDATITISATIVAIISIVSGVKITPEWKTVLALSLILAVGKCWYSSEGLRDQIAGGYILETTSLLLELEKRALRAAMLVVAVSSLALLPLVLGRVVAHRPLNIDGLNGHGKHRLNQRFAAA